MNISDLIYYAHDEEGYRVVTEPNIPMRHLPEPYEAIETIYVEREEWQGEGDCHVIWRHRPTESWAESFAELKKQIVALYEDLRETPDEELGKLPLAWKRYLEAHIAVKE